MATKKVLYICHGHPSLRPGGTEQFALELHRGVQNSKKWDSYLLVCAQFNDNQCRPDPETTGHDPHTIFCDAGSYDYFYHKLCDNYFLLTTFRTLLEEIRPDIVHFQHFLNIGVQALQVVKNVLKNTPIIYTLHEFIPICHHNGQMLKKSSQLCKAASPSQCVSCYPDIDAGLFRLREVFLKTHFELVDQFISPSHFLKDRFIAWGIPGSKIRVCENGRHQTHLRDSPQSISQESRIRLGYFGQITPYKGLDILLKAMQILNSAPTKTITLSIHGADLENSSAPYQKMLRKLLGKVPHSTSLLGPYQQAQLPRLMQQVDWVVVPSIWWENSPLVIQEAFMHRKPVICSNIGGMAEKVRDGINGLHFEVSNPQHLAHTIEKAAKFDTAQYTRLVSNIPEIPSIEQACETHFHLYKQLLAK